MLLRFELFSAIFIYIEVCICSTLIYNGLEQNGNIKIDSSGNCITAQEIPPGEPIISFNSSQIISTNSYYLDEMVKIANKVSNNTSDVSDLILLTYNFLYQLDQGNEYFTKYYADIQKYFNWNQTNWSNYNITGKYKTFPNEIETIYNSIINEIKIKESIIPTWLNLNAFFSAYSYVWLNSFKVYNQNETILIPLLSYCYDYSIIFSSDTQPILEVRKKEQQYDIVSSIPFDSDTHFSYINSIDHLTNDILLLFNHSIIKSNKYNSYPLTFTLKDPNYSFYSYVQSTTFKKTIIVKDKSVQQLHITIILIPNEVSAALFQLVIYYAKCSKCSRNFSRSRSIGIQNIKTTIMYYSIISNHINQAIAKMNNSSLNDYIVNCKRSTDEYLIGLFNLENLSMLYDQLTESYFQVIRLQWHDLQNYKHKYINAL